MRLFPQHIQPRATKIPAGSNRLDSALAAMSEQSISWPVVAKPDVGERGFMVKKLDDSQELAHYLTSFDADLIIQEFVDLPLELGVLYYRFPDDGKGTISSLCIKEPLSVVGDGRSILQDLIKSHPRARLQFKRLVSYLDHDLDSIPSQGELVLLEEIGNHSRGSKFINANRHISRELVATFDSIFSEVKGVLYGRFDLRCESLDALKRGEFRFFEFNGVASEPAHIYDPNYRIWKAYQDIYDHWRVMFDISRAQAHRGIAALSFKQGIDQMRTYWRHMKQARRLASSDLGLG